MEHGRKSTTLSPSNSMLLPYDHPVVPPEVPAGWGVEEVNRRSGSHTDRYYYEAGTARKFRSIREVDRYLNLSEEIDINHIINIPAPDLLLVLGHQPIHMNSELRRKLVSSDKQRKMIVSGGKLMRVDDEVSESHLAMVPCGTPSGMASFSLPDGWVVEEVPRRYNGWADKYYYEPRTGKKFRSLVAVERHLAELDENVPLAKILEEIRENKPLSKFLKLKILLRTLRKKVIEENTQAPPFNGPPMKVKWVLASPQGDAWNAYIADTLIPDAVKQQWAKRFKLFMNDENQ